MVEPPFLPKLTKRGASKFQLLIKPTVQSHTKSKSTTMEYAEFNPLKKQPEEPDKPELPKQYRRTYRPQKTWKVARWHHRGKRNEGMNLATESAFNKIRELVKMLYAQHGEYFYDHDLRNDYTENTDTIHAIACSTLYISLSCHPSFEYEVYYNIDSSPYKEQLEPLFHKTVRKEHLQHFDRAADMATYFQHIRTYWKDNPEHFSYLQPLNEQ